MVSREVLIPAGIAFASYVFIALWNRRRRLPPPPGPSFRELDVNALKDQPWREFQKWSQKYGPIVSWSVLGKTTVVINSPKIVLDLLEGKSAIYSERPFSWMAGHLADRKHNAFSVSINSPRFKMYRRLMHGGLNPKVAKDYRPLMEQELHTFMRELQHTPELFVRSIKRNAVAIIMKVAYGYNVQGLEDEFVKIVEAGFAGFAALNAPGRWYVEYFPWLRFLPTWFPGAGFKKFALDWRKELSLIDRKPYDWALKQIASGDYVESFTSKLLAEDTPYIPDDMKDDIIKWVSAGLYAGGGDTTVSAMTSYFYVSQVWPEAQRKAQREIDTVVGTHRLPNLEDYDSLPYTQAFIKEILRWGTVAPLGLSHCVTEDDIYDGYLIPKGSKIIANIWAIVHDEELYPNPFEFDPERHLGLNPQPDPFKYVFGFGRRACPGMHLAEMSLFLNITNILAAFTISKAKNPDGTVAEPPVNWSTGITSHLENFKCDISVRSPELLAMIQ